MPSWIHKKLSKILLILKKISEKSLPQCSTKSTNHMPQFSPIPLLGTQNYESWMRSHDVAQVWSCFIESEHNEIDEPSTTPLVLIGVALSSLSINNQGALFKIFGANYTSSFSLRIWQNVQLGGCCDRWGSHPIHEAFFHLWRLQPFREPNLTHNFSQPPTVMHPTLAKNIPNRHT